LGRAADHAVEGEGQQLGGGGWARVDRDRRKAKKAIPSGLGQARRRAGYQFGHENRPRGIEEGQPHHTQPTDFEQARQGVGRAHHPIRANLHLIIRDQHKASVKQPQKKVGLP
jgi:hypothetical protein